MRLAGPRPADQDDVALAGKETARGEIPDQSFVDRRAGKLEGVDLARQRQLGRGHLILDRASMLLGDLGREQITENVLDGMLALEGVGDHLVVGMAHADELEFGHQAEDLVSLHHHAAFRADSSWS